MTRAEMMEVIHKVAKNHRNKDFGYFTKEDIEQEVWLIALDRMGDFQPKRGTQKDEKKSFEHWINCVVSNRLKNLYRNKYVVPQRLHKARPTNLVNPICIDNVAEKSQIIEFHELIENKEIWQFLLKELNDCDLLVLDSLLSGENVGSYYKIKLCNKIKGLLDEFNGRK